MRGIRTRLTAVGVAVSALFGAFTPAAHASAYIPSGAVGPFRFVNTQNGRCLDEPYFAGGAPNGTQVQLWDCYGANSHNQHWYAFAVDGRYLIINELSGRCLDAPWNGANGTPVVVRDCDYQGNQYGQLWDPAPLLGTSPGPIADLNGRIMDAKWERIGGNGTPIQLWDDYGPNQHNQRWTAPYGPGPA